MIEAIYRVTFLTVTNNKTDYYFSSIAAIYDTFTYDDLGVKRESLYSNHDFTISPYQNKICTIRKEVVHRKKRN